MSAPARAGAVGSDRPLIAGQHPPPFGFSTAMARAVARIIGRLNGARVAYRYFHDTDPRRELAGRGCFVVETTEAGLRCRIQGELHKPTPFEFSFHRFHLTHRGIIAAVFAVADDRPAGQRGASEPFLLFETGAEFHIRREARAFGRRFARRRRTPA